MTEAEVIDRINSTIKKNGNRTITGDEMNFILKAIIELIADAGGSKPLNSVLADGNQTLEYDIILTELDRIVVGANRAGLSKGTFNTGRGGDKGVSLQCAVEFELNWQAGYLRVITPGGDGTPLLLQTDSEIVYTELVPTTPTYGRSLVDKDYADTKFPNPTGTTAEYIRGDGSIEPFPTIPTTVTNTSDLVNDGENGVNPFITALDIPMAGQAGTLVREVKNMTGATLTKGTVVYISGANGNKPIVSKALAVSDALSSRTLGLLQSNILNNGVGYCVVIGDLSGLDTSAFTEGSQLYLSGTVAGTYTETKTLAPTHLVYVGKVTRSHPTMGQIEVQIQNGYELNEIHDVAISSIANNQTLVYESATTLWKNKSLTTAEVADSTNKRYVTDANLTVIGNTSGVNTGDQDLSGKQDTLISGTNIKTINSNSLLGSGDLSIGLTYFTEAQNTTAPNATTPVDSLTAVSAATNADFAIIPKGNGAIIADIPDGLVLGGNKRGTGAVDLQMSRLINTEVSSGSNSVVSGGYRNTASNTDSSVGGGIQNTASGTQSRVGGGNQNTASSDFSTVGGGTGNTASASRTTVAGGGSCTATSYAASTLGGFGNTSTNNYASNLGGQSNTASGQYATVIGGATNSASGNYALAGGVNSIANANFSQALGYGGNVNGVIGRNAYGKLHAVAGDAQASTFIFAQRTTNATLTTFTVDGTGAATNNQLILNNNSSYRFKGTIIAKQTGTTNVAAWDIDGLLVRGANAAATTLIVSNVTLVSNLALFGTPILTADTTNGGLRIQITGLLATNIQWVANIQTTEVIY